MAVTPQELEHLRAGLAKAEASVEARSSAERRSVCRYLARYQRTEKRLDPEVRLVALHADLMVRHGIRPPPLTVGPLLFTTTLAALLSFAVLVIAGLNAASAALTALSVGVSIEIRCPRRRRLGRLRCEIQRAQEREEPEYRAALAELDRDLGPA